MQLDPRSRLANAGVYADARAMSRSVSFLIPRVTAVTFDSDTQTGVNITSGDGTGRSVVWETYEVKAHLRSVDQSLITFGHAPPGAVLGDIFFTVDPRQKALIDRAYQNENSYVYVDGQTYRITGINATGVGQADEWVCTCRSFHPLWRATGY